ncbi:MAG: hypothetical protein NT084_10910 [Bacteroidetes bacterium]|jgi:hypothetical protein|nr:hypothetical protein [Bacteroidota bacterium]
MNRNKIALVIALVLGALTFWLISKQGKSSIKAELRDFAVQDTASITKIFLVDKAAKQVTLTREADGRWKLDGKYYARPDGIKNLLVTIHDLSVREPVGLKAQENVIKELATGSTKCEIYAGDKLLKQYYVGSETADMMGTYMLLSDISDPDNIVNSSEPFIMEIKGFNGYLTTRYFTNKSEWRDRTAFHYFVPDIHSISIQHAGDPANSFTITQSAGNNVFSLQNMKGDKLPFDTIAIKQFVSYFGNIGFENFANDMPKHEIDSITHSVPAHIITVIDGSNKKTEIKMFLKKNKGFAPDDTTAAKPPLYDADRMFALMETTGDFVIVQYYVFGKLLQTPDYFMPGKSAKAPSKKK